MTSQITYMTVSGDLFGRSPIVKWYHEPISHLVQDVCVTTYHIEIRACANAFAHAQSLLLYVRRMKDDLTKTHRHILEKSMTKKKKESFSCDAFYPLEH